MKKFLTCLIVLSIISAGTTIYVLPLGGGETVTAASGTQIALN